MVENIRNSKGLHLVQKYILRFIAPFSKSVIFNDENKCFPFISKVSYLLIITYDIYNTICMAAAGHLNIFKACENAILLYLNFHEMVCKNFSVCYTHFSFLVVIEIFFSNLRPLGCFLSFYNFFD